MFRARYNIVYHCHKSSMMAVQGDLEGARNVLLDELSSVAAMRSWTVTVSRFTECKMSGVFRSPMLNSPNVILMTMVRVPVLSSRWLSSRNASQHASSPFSPLTGALLRRVSSLSVRSKGS